MDTDKEKYHCYIVKSKQCVSWQYLQYDPILKKFWINVHESV